MKYDCPSCGRPFNGKKCRNCGYESFDEEIAHRLHTHKGEPLVIRDSQRRPIPTADPFGCPPKGQPRKRRSTSWPGLVVTVCCLLSVLLSAAKDLPFLRQPVPDLFSFFSGPQLALPEDAIPIYSDKDLEIYAQWDPAAGLVPDIPLYIRNNTSKRLLVETENITVNGFDLDQYTYLSLTVPAKGLEAGGLYLNSDGLEFCQIAQLKTLVLRFRLRDPNTWADKGATGYCAFPVESPADYVQPSCDQGPLVFEDEHLRVILRDIQMISAFENEKMVQMPQFLFYVENKSGEDLSVYTSGTTLNGSDSNADIWVDLPPCSKTVTPCLCTDLFFDSQEDIHSISTALHYTVGDLAESSQDVTVSLN